MKKAVLFGLLVTVLAVSPVFAADACPGAETWVREMAEKGNVDAQATLGICYDAGRGVEQNYEKSLYWFRKAAEQGHADAQAILGYKYMQGLGVPKDYEQGLYWYRKAAEQGHAEAKEFLKDMEH